MRRSHLGRTAFLAAVLISVPALAGCFSAGDATRAPAGAPGPTRSGLADVENSSSGRRASGAAAFLPDFSGKPFAVDDLDLAAKRNPLRAATRLIEAAVGEGDAPRFEVTGVEAATTAIQIQKTIDLTTAAIRCLHQKGHLEMHAYVDTRYRYSMSVALVTNAQAFTNIDLGWCAVTSVIPYQSEPDPAVPTIAPCVSSRTTGRALVTWVGTTDVMCAALGGDPVAPVDRPLLRGNAGTDVAALQLALNDVGSDLTVDGRLGADTTAALRAFQGCFPVPDARPGVADATTRSALRVAQTSGWSREQCQT